MRPDSSITIFKRTILFLALLVLSVIACNLLYYHFYLRQSDLDITDRQLEKEIYKTKILLMGDSLLSMDLDPRSINDSFCFASRGENYFETYYKLRKVLSKNAKPDVIVLPVFIESFSSKKMDHPLLDVWYWKRYFSYTALTWETRKLDFLKARIEDSVEFLGTAKYSIDRHMIKGDSSLYKGFRLYGHRLIFSNLNNHKKLDLTLYYLKRIRKSELFQSFLLKYFELTLALAKENGIKIVLIKPPMSDIYLKLSQNYIDLDAFFRTVSGITKKYPNVYTLDYQNLIKDESLFYDPIHLNINGAQVLSKKFNQDLKNLGLSFGGTL